VTRRIEGVTKQLLIMRHAKSSWKDDSISDHDRPLNPRGLKDAPAMGRFVADAGCLPSLILTSTANRAKTTAQMFTQACGQEIPVVTQKALYHPGIKDYCEVVNSQANQQDRIMVVSHNPGSEEWLYLLTATYEALPTAAIAIVDFPESTSWQTLGHQTRGRLQAIWRPKEVL